VQQMIAVQGLEEEAERTEGTSSAVASSVVASLDISLVALECIEEEVVALGMHKDRMKEQGFEELVVALEEQESLEELVQLVVVLSEWELVEELSCRLASVQISST